MTPCDALLKKFQLERTGAGVEEYRAFVEELIVLIDRTHDTIHAIRQDEQFKALGDAMWNDIFEKKI